MSIITLFNNYISERYEYLQSLLRKKIKNEYECDEILHFTIDYFYKKYSDEKLNDLIQQKPNGTAMDSYLIKALYFNYNSPSAPYKQSNKHYKEWTHFDFPFEQVEEAIEEINYDLMYQPEEVEQISDLLLKLVYTDYVKSKFRSLHHWEYAKKILHLHIIEGISYNEIQRKTNISTNTLRYNFRKLKNILYNIITDKDLLDEIIPSNRSQNIWNSVNQKLIKNYMDYYKVLEQYQINLPNIHPFLLKKCASQKVKYVKDGTKRETVCIIVDMMDHLVRCKGIVIDRLLAQERINLVHEYQGVTPYGKPGCGSCMDRITRYFHNAIHKNKDLIKNWKE